MQNEDNILELLRKKGAEAARLAHRGVILQPGSIGDCILTLSLVGFMKDYLDLGGVDIIGHTEYIGIFPGRTSVDSARSIDLIDLHRLFAESKTFDLADGDPLIKVFDDYTWIVTFVGEPDSNFEQNLIFTANCSRGSEVVTLLMKPSNILSSHITDFYVEQFIAQSGMPLEPRKTVGDERLIKATEADANTGRELLNEIDIDYFHKLVIIAPGSGGLQKCWHLDNFLAVAEGLVSGGVEVVFLLGPAEMERFGDTAIRKINSIGKCLSELSLAEVLGLLSCVDAFLSNDSGITHLAAGLGVKTLAVFGPTNPDLYRPLGPVVTVFTDGAQTFAEKPSMGLQQEVLGTLLV